MNSSIIVKNNNNNVLCVNGKVSKTDNARTQLSFLNDQPFVDRPLGFRRFSPQTQVLQRVVKMFVNLFSLLGGFKVWKVFPDFLYKLIQNLNCDLEKKQAGKKW